MRGIVEQVILMTFPDYYQQRLKDLEDNIKQDLELLKDYDDELRYTTDPRTKARYRREIVRQKESVAHYKQEYTKLEQESVGTPSPQMQEVGIQLRQMDAKLNILLSGQVAIYEDLLIQLNQTQLVLTQKLQDAVDANQVSEPQMQQMLAVLEERIPLLPPNQAAIAEVFKDPELDVKQKLKVTLPIVPMLVNYEGEFELGSGFNIKTAWEQLLSRLRIQPQPRQAGLLSSKVARRSVLLGSTALGLVLIFSNVPLFFLIGNGIILVDGRCVLDWRNAQGIAVWWEEALSVAVSGVLVLCWGCWIFGLYFYDHDLGSWSQVGYYLFYGRVFYWDLSDKYSDVFDSELGDIWVIIMYVFFLYYIIRLIIYIISLIRLFFKSH